MEIRQIVTAQRDYFRSGATRSTAVRILMLDRLYSEIRQLEPEIHEAIQKDLGKSAFESYMCETGLTLSEISYMKKHLEKFAKTKRVHTPLAQFPSRSYILKEPYGTVLIMSPWNYPFLLSVEPLVDAIAAGNTVVLKPSAYSPHTSAVIKKLISRVFSEEYVSVVEGGRAENKDLLEQEFDYIFFTGGTQVGKIVLQKAAEHFTPVTLEMGGKSPCIVDETADLKTAAKRIAFGKFLNCGQTCVAPDYLLIQESVRDQFLPLLESAIREMYGADALANPNYGRIVNEKHFARLTDILEGESVIFGGETSKETLQIAPTLVGPATPDGPAMGQEIFGPILPVLTFQALPEAIDFVASRPRPLALYLFSRTRENIQAVETQLSYGGGCINDTIIHLASSEMGFGGVGMSGMGSYHGKYGFDTFTHEKSIVSKSNLIDLPFRYQPYSALKEKLIRMFLR